MTETVVFFVEKKCHILSILTCKCRANTTRLICLIKFIDILFRRNLVHVKIHQKKKTKVPSKQHLTQDPLPHKPTKRNVDAFCHQSTTIIHFSPHSPMTLDEEPPIKEKHKGMVWETGASKGDILIGMSSANQGVMIRVIGALRYCVFVGC